MRSWKNRTERKLRDVSGASITFALLLFLVCSVACAVVITAATAVSGRMGKAAENDQRYFSVISAAGLLKEIMEEHTVSVVQTTTGTRTVRYTGGVAGEPADNGDAVKAVYLVTDKNASAISEADLTDENRISEGGGKTADSILEDAAARCAGDTAIVTDFTREMQLSSSMETDGKDPLKVTIRQTLNPTGDMAFVLFNTEGEPYRLEMRFRADRKTTAGTTETKGPRMNISGSGGDLSYDVAITRTQMEITSFSWKLTLLDTVVTE